MKTPTHKTKIVATLGLNSADQPTIEKLIAAGMNVARINFSHSDHATNGAAIDAVRAAAEKVGQSVAILQDLCGPKIRIGDFADDTVTLKPRQTFTLTTKKIVGDSSRVYVSYTKLPQEVSKGDEILINDGKLRLLVQKTSRTDIVCKVVVGGTIRGRRGVNVPGAQLSLPALTAKDKKDLAFGLQKGVHFVTLSFVRTAKDIHGLRRLLAKAGSAAHIIAKIETREAVENIAAIVQAADGIMVARGDLAIEVRRTEVPLIQKDIIRLCNQLGKPVITATQMLDSMREAEVPTRAEVNDVANAILDGTDAVMLSDETTVGTYPVQAVSMLAEIAHTIEASQPITKLYRHVDGELDTVAESVTAAIAREAARLQVAAVVALSESGTTARLIARFRLGQNIYVLTPNEDTFYHTLLVYGCRPVLTTPVEGVRSGIAHARHMLTQQKAAKKNDLFIFAAGMPFGEPGSTNMMVIERV